MKKICTSSGVPRTSSTYIYERKRKTRQRAICISADASPSATPRIWATTAMYTVRISAVTNGWFGSKIRCFSRCQSSAATSVCTAVISSEPTLLLQRERSHVPFLQDLQHRAVLVHRVDRLLNLRLERGVLRSDCDADRLRRDRLPDDLDGVVLRRVPRSRRRVGLVDVDVPRLQGDDAERIFLVRDDLDRRLSLRLALHVELLERLQVRRRHLGSGGLAADVERRVDVLRIALLRDQRLADAEVVDEGDALGARGRVVHPADDCVALVREERGDDAVEAGVLELRLVADQLGHVGADVDVRAEILAALDELLGRVADVAAEEQGLGVSRCGRLRSRHREDGRPEDGYKQKPSGHRAAPFAGGSDSFIRTRICNLSAARSSWAASAASAARTSSRSRATTTSRCSATSGGSYSRSSCSKASRSSPCARSCAAERRGLPCAATRMRWKRKSDSSASTALPASSADANASVAARSSSTPAASSLPSAGSSTMRRSA